MKRTVRMMALACALLMLSAACGKTEPQTPEEETAALQTQTTEADTTVPVSQTNDEPVSEAETDVSVTEEESTEPAEITLEAGLNSTDVAEVLAFYKLAAAKNDAKQYTKTLNLLSLDGGEGKVAKYVNVFEPIARKAASKNTVTGDPLPGKYAAIREADWKSASAVSDGNYTTIRVAVAPQTDGANGKAFEGPVGRSMTVLDGVDQAINEMPGVSADFENGEVKIEYQNPTITVKVDNRTGKFVEGACKWTYRVNATMVSLDCKVLAWGVHLQNASGVIDYTISY